MTAHEEWEEFEGDPWPRRFVAGQQAKAERKRSVAGCLPPLILIPIMILLAMFSARAAETGLPAGYGCADVRAAVEKYGRAKAARLARRNGATSEQIAAAEKCL